MELLLPLWADRMNTELEDGKHNYYQITKLSGNRLPSSNVVKELITSGAVSYFICGAKLVPYHTGYHNPVNGSRKSNRLNPCIELKTCTGENIVNTKVDAITKPCEHPTVTRPKSRIHTLRIREAVFGAEPSMIYRMGRCCRETSCNGYNGLCTN